MASWLEQLAARVAFLHASRVFRRFERTLGDVESAQRQALRRTLAVVQGSALARRLGLRRVATLDDLRRAVRLQTYEDVRPAIDQVAAGDFGALFAPGVPVLMFATTSGTTSQRKLIPVTPAFVRDYRRGWNTFGLKLLSDHPRAVLRGILQSSGRADEARSPAGVPIGAITGLLASTQKSIVRRFYVGHPRLAEIGDASARYYALARFGIVRDVAFCITANPATLLRIAQTGDAQSERLIRDVRDGTLSAEIVPDDVLRRELERRLRPAPARAAELERIRRATGGLRPRDYWRLEFLACWTGGSMSHYLPALVPWFGELPVRDVGLLASEGRVTIPLVDGTASGVLDPLAAVFEFIPAENVEHEQPETLTATQLETGRDYAIVLSNATGLLRYRLNDVVRVTGFIREAPLLQFLHRAGRVSSLAGEKLTEQQLVAAVAQVARELSLPLADFIAAGVWSDPPYYRITTPAMLDAVILDRALCMQNDEYASRRSSGRLAPLQVRSCAAQALQELDRRQLAARGSTAEQYKRTHLFCTPGQDDEALRP